MVLGRLDCGDGGGGGFEGFSGVPEIENGDFGGEFATPDGEGRIRGEFEGGGDDFAASCGEDLVLMEGGEGEIRVAESEFMEGFDDGDERHGEEEHFRVIERTEELLELNERGEEMEIFVGDEGARLGGEEIDGVAGEEERDVPDVFDGVREGNAGCGVFGEVADDEVEIGGS